MCQESFVDIDDFILVNEGKLHVNLCKLRLTVRTKVLITEALCQLEVTVIARAHQQLFKKLRRLRKRIEVARMHTARHQIISCSFRCALAEHRSLDLNEAFFIHKVADALCDFAPEDDILLDVRTS